jgi:CheY-like chemotaxis protein
MSSEQLSRLFEPFNRLGAESTGIEGTGIGLTVAKGLVEFMDGRIEVESRVGHGSGFTVLLPRADEPHSVREKAPADPADGRPAATLPQPIPSFDASGSSLDVLYVEDNDVNVMVVQQALGLLPNLTMRVARSGAEALTLAGARRPDLLLLDMHLGDMLGLDVKARLDANPATAGIRCIVLSADAMPEQIQRAHGAGVVDYLTKPFELRDLLMHVQAAMEAVGKRKDETALTGE